MINAIKVEFKFDEKSIEKFGKSMEEIEHGALMGGEAGVQHLMNLVHARAKATCPMNTGYLRESLFQEIEVDGNTINANVGHGGKYQKFNIYSGKYTDEYAVEVHEGHKVSLESRRFGGTWKWLEKAQNSIRDKYEDILQEYITAYIMGKDAKELESAITQIYAQLASVQRARTARRLAMLAEQRKKNAEQDTEWQALIKAVRDSSL
jgi:hypothetical protein